MKKKLDPKDLYRFDKEQDAYHIDISLDVYLDVFNPWDYSPLRRRDIDKDLMQYLKECSNEIPLRHQLIMNFYLPESVRNPEEEAKQKSGIQNYFAHATYTAGMKRKRYDRSTFYYALSGFIFLVLGLFIERLLPNPLFKEILAQGLFIGGWVLFWESFSFIFFSRRAVVREIREFERLQEAAITYQYVPQQEVATPKEESLLGKGTVPKIAS